MMRAMSPHGNGKQRLATALRPCGPVLDARAAERAREIVAETAWTPELERAWPALAPVFGASPYLAGLARRDPQRLADLLADDPDVRLADILERTTRPRRRCGS